MNLNQLYQLNINTVFNLIKKGQFPAPENDPAIPQGNADNYSKGDLATVNIPSHISPQNGLLLSLSSDPVDAKAENKNLMFGEFPNAPNQNALQVNKDPLLNVGLYFIDPNTGALSGASGIQIDPVQLSELRELQKQIVEIEMALNMNNNVRNVKLGALRNRQIEIIEMQHKLSPRWKEMDRLEKEKEKTEEEIRQGKKISTNELTAYVEITTRYNNLLDALKRETDELQRRIKLDYYTNKQKTQGLNPNELADLNITINTPMTPVGHYSRESGPQKQKLDILQKKKIIEEKISNGSASKEDLGEFYSLNYDQYRLIEREAYHLNGSEDGLRVNEDLRRNFLAPFFYKDSNMPVGEVLEYLLKYSNDINEPAKKIAAGELIELVRKAQTLKANGQDLNVNEKARMLSLGIQVMNIQNPRDISQNNFDGKAFSSSALTGLTSYGSSYHGTIFINDSYLNGSKFSDSKKIILLYGSPALADANSRSDFTGARMRRVHLRNCYAAFCIFNHTDLSGGDLTNGQFQNSDFSDALMGPLFLSFSKDDKLTDLSGSDFSRSTFINTYMRNLIANGTNLSDSYIYNSNLENFNQDPSGEIYIPKTNFNGAVIIRSNLRFSNLKGSNFVETFIEDSDLSNSIFNGADLSKVLVVKCNIQGGKFDKETNIENAFVINSDLTGSIFDGTNLTNSNLSGSDLLNVKFVNKAKLNRIICCKVKTNDKTEFNNAEMTRAKFPDARINGSKFIKCNLSGSSFLNSTINGAEYDSDTILSFSDFSGANLYDVKFNEIKNLDNARFIGVTAEKIKFNSSNLTKSNFYNSTLTDVSFFDCDLTAASLQDAKTYKLNLNKAKLIGANLFNCKLTGANLKGAKLCGSTLQGADLTGVEIDDETDFSGAVYDDSTTLPGIDNSDNKARAAFAEKHGLVHINQIELKAYAANAEEAGKRIKNCFEELIKQQGFISDAINNLQNNLGLEDGWLLGIGPDSKKGSEHIQSQHISKLCSDIEVLKTIANKGFTPENEKRFKEKYEEIFGVPPGQSYGLTREERLNILKKGIKPGQADNISKEFREQAVKDYNSIPKGCTLGKTISAIQEYIDNKQEWSQGVSIAGGTLAFIACTVLSAAGGGYPALLLAPLLAGATNVGIQAANGKAEIDYNTGKVNTSYSSEELDKKLSVEIITGYVALPLGYVGKGLTQTALSKGGGYVLSRVGGKTVARFVSSSPVQKSAKFLNDTVGHASVGGSFTFSHALVENIANGKGIETALKEGFKHIPEGAIGGIVFAHGVNGAIKIFHKGLQLHQAGKTPTSQGIQTGVTNKKIVLDETDLPIEIVNSNSFLFAKRNGELRVEVVEKLPENVPAQTELVLGRAGNSRTAIIRINRETYLKMHQKDATALSRFYEELDHANRKLNLIDPLKRSLNDSVELMPEIEYCARRSYEEFSARSSSAKRMGIETDVNILKQIKGHIDKGEYKEAFELAKKNGLQEADITNYRTDYKININPNRTQLVQRSNSGISEGRVRLSAENVNEEFHSILKSSGNIHVAGKSLSRGEFDKLGLPDPTYKISFGDENAYFLSKPFFDKKIGRPSFILYLVTKEGIFARGLYKSESHNTWNVASHIAHNGWIGKGLGQGTVRLPIEVTSTLANIESKFNWSFPQENHLCKVLEVKGLRSGDPPEDFIFAPRPLNESFDGYLRTVMNIKDLGSFTKLHDPASFKFDNEVNKPDFDSGVKEIFQNNNPLYGKVTSFVVESHCKKILYQFSLDSEGRAWVAAIQSKSEVLNNYGVKIHSIDVPDRICTPAYNYHDEMIFEFRGNVNPRNEQYYDNSAFTNKIPIVKEFLEKVAAKQKQ